MDAVFPLKSKKSIKAFNQAVSHNNAIMRLQIQNALYQKELNRVKAANDSVNSALALAQQQAHEARVSAAAALAQQQAHEARVSAAAALAQRQAHEARVSAATALAQQQARQVAVALANTNKKELIVNHNNKKSSKFGKLLSKMNKQH